VAYAPINLARLGEVEKGTLVTPDVLAHDGLIADTRQPVKILGVGDAPAGITIHAHAFSKSALDKLRAAGSTVQLLSWPDSAPIDEKPARPEGKRAERRRAGIERAERVAAGGDAAPVASARTKAKAAADDDGDEAPDEAPVADSKPEEDEPAAEAGESEPTA
jgi:hypothetical protein